MPQESILNGFGFVLGAGEVIKAWDLGVATMKIGEKAVLKCDAELGYGEQGIGPIPPNSELVFEVELLHIGNVPKEAGGIIMTQHNK